MLCSAPKLLAEVAAVSEDKALKVCSKFPPTFVSAEAKPANATDAIAVDNNNLFFMLFPFIV